MTEEIGAVIYSVDGSLARITLNRPEKRNALNKAMVRGLKNALSDAERDDAVRAVIITGAGKDFCSGADLAELQKFSEASVAQNVEDASLLMELFVMIRHARMP